MPRDEFTAEAFFMGFAEGWTAAGGDTTVGSCPVPEPHFEEVEYLIDQVIKTKNSAVGYFRRMYAYHTYRIPAVQEM